MQFRTLTAIAFVALAATSANAQVNVDIGLGGPTYYQPVEPRPVYHRNDVDWRNDRDRHHSYDWNYWHDHDRHDDDRPDDDHYDNGNHKGWDKHR